MIDKDIREMFYKKNKEIFINKLILDINNNMDSLEATILNITYLEFAIYRNKIIGIDDSLKTKKAIEKMMLVYEKKVNTKIEHLMSDKSNRIVKYIEKMNVDKGVSSYEKELTKSTEIFGKELNAFIADYLNKEVIPKLLVNEWYMRNDKKINFFLREKLEKDLLNKIISEIGQRDIIIFNNAKESYNKYLDLNANIEK